MTIRNLTPHSITIKHLLGEVTIPPDPAGPARVAQTPGGSICGHAGGRVESSRLPGEWGSIDIREQPTWGEVEGLPAPEYGVLLIVSLIVALRCPGRDDVVSPGTGPGDECIREDGRIVAVTRLIRAPYSEGEIARRKRQ